MRCPTFLALAILGWAAPAAADPAPVAYNLRYEAFSLGFAIMQMDVAVRIFPSSYSVAVNYRTVGLAHFLYPGQQHDQVSGTWVDDRASPQSFSGQGEWRGQPRRIEIAYRQGQPQVLALSPPDVGVREPVPVYLQRNTEDTLSALAQLLHHVGRTNTCNTAARVFDGRRLSEIDASSAGMQSLGRLDGAIFSGTALRCDFVGRMLAGFELNRPHPTPGRPRQGSAWFASPQPGAPMLPVRMEFGTDWFGSVTMVMTGATPQESNLEEVASSPR
jgi:hypothetical protein